ncbi:MAG: transposase [Chromatiales bacterium]|jgi:REP element-mobilizing transposase RayT
MSRPLRLEFAGALYHITSRGDRRESIYEDDEDRQQFLLLMDDVCDRYNWVCHAYCLMSNHYHLLIETPDANLSRGMRQLNGVYTQNFNRRHDRVGHVFQGRYKAILVEKKSYLLELARYIVLNPVRAQMVRSAYDWPWSSYRATAGLTASRGCLHTDWILAEFGKRKQQAIVAYRQFITKGKGQPSPWQELTSQVYLGSETFIDKILHHIDKDKELDEIPSSQRRPVAMTLADYQNSCSNRNMAIVEAYRNGGYTLKDIGQHFGLHYSTVSGIIKNHKSKT